MISFLTAAASFIAVLGFLVIVHELGHYLAARHVGVRVERFAIFFPLPFRTRFIPDRIYSKTVGETEYVVNWLPLGGYVKLLGQNLDDEDPSDPENYAAKTKLQRAYILFAGPAMNLVAAVLLMTVFHMVGVERPDYQPQVARVEESTLAAKAGFQAGDRIVRVGATEIGDWEQLNDTVFSEAARSERVVFTVEREGTTRTLEVDSIDLAAGKHLGIRYVTLPMVGGFEENSPARDAGMQVGDRIVSVNGQPIATWNEIPPAIQRSEGRPLTLVAERGGERLTFNMKAGFDAQRQVWLVQIRQASVLQTYGPVEAAWLGVKKLVYFTQISFVFLGRLIGGHGSLDAVGGPLRIAGVVGEASQVSLGYLISVMAIISLNLGIINLFPIPALDGGHLLLLAVEAVKRGPLSTRVRERTQMIGLSLLLLLMVLITYNDVRLMFFTNPPG